MTTNGLRIGIIDLGTNSVRFDIHQLQADGKTRLLHREKLMVRLGENLFLKGRLEGAAIRRTLQAFASFARTAGVFKADKIIAFATSALREAKDAQSLIEAIRDDTGILVRVISGREEARLIAQGVLAHYRGKRGGFGLIDIGGGSTEISVIRSGTLLCSESFPIGVARLQQVFLQQSPPSKEAIKSLREHLRRVLSGTMKTEKWPRVGLVIGSSGTIRALLRIAKVGFGRKTLGRETLRRMTKAMSTMSLDELRQMPGLEPKRIDLILAGAIVLEECLDALKASKVLVTRYALRDGILSRELAQLQPVAEAKPRSGGGSLESLIEEAARFGQRKTHLEQLARTTRNLFFWLEPVHRLDARWLEPLTTAVLLKDSGKHISPVSYERHSAYIARNIGLAFTDKWEAELVASLILQHKSEDLEFKEFPLKRILRPFVRLLALLRLIDGLDAAHQEGVVPTEVRFSADTVRLRLTTGSLLDLTLLRLHARKSLFEQEFGRVLEFVS